MKKQNVISILDLFSGVGGFADAAEQTGFHVDHVGFCEIDQKCREILKAKYPDAPIYTDVTSFDTSHLQFDVLCFGAPCQSFSRNGQFYNKNNMTIPNGDHRANLFLEAVRILNTNKPKSFIFENVKEILTVKNEDGDSFFSVILEAFDL